MKSNIRLLFLFIIFGANNVIGQNVGIGILDPDEKLEVDGRISAKGYKNTILSDNPSNTFYFNTISSWEPVTDLSDTITLDVPTTVIVNYGISVQLQSSTAPSSLRRIALAINIDNSRFAPSTNSFPEEGQLQHLNGQYVTDLSAGTHTISIDYKVPSLFSTFISFAHGDIFERRLDVLIFGSN